jgi:prepilin-type N-terminal cleavage/methylation domain-containing protein
MMSPLKTVSDQRGFTLIELIAAVTILAIVIAPSLGLFSASFKNNRVAKEKTMAVALAQSKLEELKAMHYHELSALVETPVEEIPVEAQSQYSRCTDILQREPKLLEINVTVYWAGGEVSFSTLKGDTE